MNAWIAQFKGGEKIFYNNPLIFLLMVYSLLVVLVVVGGVIGVVVVGCGVIGGGSVGCVGGFGGGVFFVVVVVVVAVEVVDVWVTKLEYEHKLIPIAYHISLSIFLS